MSKGLGRIQRGCLRAIEEYEAAGKRPTMLNIASEVYRVSPDRLSEAQQVHEAVPQCGSFEVRFPDDRPSQYRLVG
jgi:hypothetical protein